MSRLETTPVVASPLIVPPLGLERLEGEVRSIIKAAGYDPDSLVLEARLIPGQGWYFAALVKTGIRSRRYLAYHFGSTDEFVAYLRRAVGLAAGKQGAE